MSIILVAHAGAWNAESEVDKQIDIKAVNDAVNVGILKDNLIDIAVETVVFLENHEKLDAGLGSIYLVPIVPDGNAYDNLHTKNDIIITPWDEAEDEWVDRD